MHANTQDARIAEGEQAISIARNLWLQLRIYVSDLSLSDHFQRSRSALQLINLERGVPVSERGPVVDARRWVRVNPGKTRSV